MMLLPPGCRAADEIVQEVVPVQVPLAPRSLAQVTLVTATLSELVPDIAMEAALEFTAAVAGEVIVTVGDTSSVRVTVSVSTPVLLLPSVAVTVIRLSPNDNAIGPLLQLVVPVQLALPPRLFDQVTDLIVPVVITLPASDRVAAV